MDPLTLLVVLAAGAAVFYLVRTPEKPSASGQPAKPGKLANPPQEPIPFPDGSNETAFELVPGQFRVRIFERGRRTS